MASDGSIQGLVPFPREIGFSVQVCQLLPCPWPAGDGVAGGANHAVLPPCLELDPIGSCPGGCINDVQCPLFIPAMAC